MSLVEELPDGSLKCSCGAMVKKGEGRGRFRKRHPEKCSKMALEKEEKREFTKSFLGTKSVKDEFPELDYQNVRGIMEQSDRIKDTIDLILREGRGITEWERDFLNNCYQGAKRLEWMSESRKVVLKRIFDQRL